MPKVTSAHGRSPPGRRRRCAFIRDFGTLVATGYRRWWRALSMFAAGLSACIARISIRRRHRKRAVLLQAMLGRCRGAAVRLTTGSDGLAVCEGIETGLSLAAGLDAGVAVWAALSTSGVVGLGLPEPAFARALLIATDGDAAGWRAGEALADRAADQGWRVEMVSAPSGRTSTISPGWTPMAEIIRNVLVQRTPRDARARGRCRVLSRAPSRFQSRHLDPCNRLRSRSKRIRGRRSRSVRRRF